MRAEHELVYARHSDDGSAPKNPTLYLVKVPNVASKDANAALVDGSR